MNLCNFNLKIMTSCPPVAGAANLTAAPLKGSGSRVLANTGVPVTNCYQLSLAQLVADGNMRYAPPAATLHPRS